jgi:hypothetical protein
MAKDEGDARAEGFKRGLAGSGTSAGLTQGWTDDKAAGLARNEGYVQGKRKRSQIAAGKGRKAKS